MGKPRGALTHLYQSKAWRDARRVFLAAHPWCVECARHGVQTRASIVDHVQPHKGNMDSFWSRANWQGLCVPCHNSKTNRFDGGFGNRRSVGGCDANGMPIDSAHPWSSL